MTSIEQSKYISHSPNLYSFIEGERAGSYVHPEEKGFRSSGNVGLLLNVNEDKLKSVKDGLLLNPVVDTDNSNNIVGNLHANKRDFIVPSTQIIKTPLKYCQDYSHQSNLAPYYFNGEENIVLSPDCNFQIGNGASPTLYGATTFLANTPEVLNTAYNSIGHEIDTFGMGNEYGGRALTEVSSACQKLQPGFNVPLLKTENNTRGAFLAERQKFSPHQGGMYAVGDWVNGVPDNFVKNFQNSQYCGSERA